MLLLCCLVTCWALDYLARDDKFQNAFKEPDIWSMGLTTLV